MDTTELGSKLDNLYYNPADPGSYGGVQRLLRRAKEVGIKDIDSSKVTKYLAKQQAYSLHKPARKRFKRNPTIVGKMDQQWQADLADMQSLSDENDGYTYILTMIDIFSKYAWVMPVKSKSAPSIVQAFSEILKQARPRKPEKIQTDAGKEFLNKHLQELFAQHHIKHFVTASCCARGF